MRPREIHGVARAWKIGMAGIVGWQDVTITEVQGHVLLSLSANAYPAELTPDQARYLARRLHRLARLVEAAEVTEPPTQPKET